MPLVPIVAAVSLVLVLFAFIFTCLRALEFCTQHNDEPPILGNSIPFITPLLGILKERTNFMVQMRNKNYGIPIYTLRLPGTRIYVINSPSLVIRMQRQKRTIAFEPIPAQAARHIMGVSKPGVQIIGRDCTSADSYFNTFLKATHPVLSRGSELDAMNKTCIEIMNSSLSKMSNQTTKTNLYDWVRHEIFMATTEATYGPSNPFSHGSQPGNEALWNEFEPAIMLQMLQVHGLFPSGRAGYRARERLVDEFYTYFNQGISGSDQVGQSMALVKVRYEHNKAQGLSTEDIARTEVGQVAASVSNTVPAAFWMLWHVLSDPVLLAECRQEIENSAETQLCTQLKAPQGRSPGCQVCILDMSKLTDRAICPILVSTWHEVLRYNHVGIAARVVMEDTFLDQYYLKKGSSIMVVNPVMHTDVSVWGPSACDFRPYRFMEKETPDTNAKDTAEYRRDYTNTSKWAERPEKSPACRIFGGGSTLCPGRHFASQEVLSLVAMTIMRFEVRPLKGCWVAPKKIVPLPTALPIPEASSPGDLEVEIVPRQDDRSWSFVYIGK